MIKKLNTFTIDYQSQLEDRQYEGKFTARIASMGDKSKIAVRKAQLCGGMYTVRDDEGRPTGRGIDEDTEWMAHMQAWLEVVLVQKPDWFKFDELADESLVLKVFTEVMKFENTFRSRGRTSSEGLEGSVQGGEGNSAGESAEADASNTLKKVVGVEVQAALDA